MGIAENTIVIYTTDNGPNAFSWPDAAASPYRSEKKILTGKAPIVYLP
jgi:arylsulfatase